MYAYSATGDINHNYTQLIHSGNFKNLKGRIPTISISQKQHKGL